MEFRVVSVHLDVFGVLVSGTIKLSHKSDLSFSDLLSKILLPSLLYIAHPGDQAVIATISGDAFL
jgi:hypothetical protein